MLWLFVFACGDEDGDLQVQEDAAYSAGCDEGQIAGTVTGAADGKECRERQDVPLDTARKGMVEYCGFEATDEDACYWWEIGYLDCWRAGYDMSYPAGWDKGDCTSDSGK